MKLQNGMAMVTLGVQNEPGIKSTMTRPSTQKMLDKISAGTLVAHFDPTTSPEEGCDHHDGDHSTATSAPARRQWWVE